MSKLPPVDLIEKICHGEDLHISEALGEMTVSVSVDRSYDILLALRNDKELAFDQLIDLCGVDFSAFGQESEEPDCSFPGAPELSVVYHLLSLDNSFRLRLKVQLDKDVPILRSVANIWPVANWLEREAFDMYGMIFEGHPDLRRLLTDYGFIGHPFRKDFPISGHVEMRYDEEKGRVVYQPVSIEPRVLVPRVIREEGYGG